MNELQAMRIEFEKLCARDVTHSDAVAALERLQKLDKEKPTGGQVSRGALAGSAAGTIARTASGLVSGDIGRALVTGDAAKGTVGALRQPGVKGKLLGVGQVLAKGLHNTAAAAAGSAAFGATMPIIRGHMDREAEKDKLRVYLGQQTGGPLRRASKEYLGV